MRLPSPINKLSLSRPFKGTLHAHINGHRNDTETKTEPSITHTITQPHTYTYARAKQFV